MLWRQSWKRCSLRGGRNYFLPARRLLRGSLYYLYNVLWVDKLAGNFPRSAIGAHQNGKRVYGCFDMCLVVAMRNANVFLDLTDSTCEHVRLAINKVGAQRMMFAGRKSD